jgi:hypothetical protein
MSNPYTPSKRRQRSHKGRYTRRKHIGRTRPYPWKSSWITASPFRDLASAKNAEKAWKKGGQKSAGFTATSSLKSMGRIVRSHGKYEIGDKYKTIQ